jgi:hypothetical protein
VAGCPVRHLVDHPADGAVDRLEVILVTGGERVPVTPDGPCSVGRDRTWQDPRQVAALRGQARLGAGQASENRLRLTLEAYDFNRAEKEPHLRFEGRYFLTKNLFAFAGWDDPTYSQRRSVLLGGGVTWGDEDLKYLLGTIGSAVPK